jgi:hypothetical protein
MTTRLGLLILTTLFLTKAKTQDSKSILPLEQTVAEIDSVILVGKNIGQYIRPLFSDDGGDIFLKNRYTIDTTKKLLHKVIYDFTNFEQVTFYYNNQKILKIIVNDTSLNGKPYQCEYYFDSDSPILIKEQGIVNAKTKWNSKTVTSQAKQYLADFIGICDMLDKRK